MLGEKERCGQCRRLIENCVCRYDFLDNIPIFVRRRSIAHYKKKSDELYRITRMILMVNWLLENLPQVYLTRSGCEVEEHPMQAHSDHDGVRNIGALIISEYNELLVSLYTGSYNSAIRCTRAILEWLVKYIAAVSDANIISRLESDKNKAFCFEGLNRAIDISKIKENLQRSGSDEYRQKMKFLKAKIKSVYGGNTSLFLQRLPTIKVPDGVGNIPARLPDSITSHLAIVNAGKKYQGKAVLYEIYNILSTNIHMGQNELFSLQPGGTAHFFDQDRFQETYNTIMQASDTILYLFILLIDIDVFTWYEESRINWRRFMKGTFEASKIITEEYFQSTKALLNSDTWNSDSASMFIALPPNAMKKN